MKKEDKARKRPEFAETLQSADSIYKVDVPSSKLVDHKPGSASFVTADGNKRLEKLNAKVKRALEHADLEITPINLDYFDLRQQPVTSSEYSMYFCGNYLALTNETSVDLPLNRLTNLPAPFPQPDLWVHLNHDLLLGFDQDAKENVEMVRHGVVPCRVIVDHAAPLRIAVYNRKFERGPAGYYYDHLFICRGAPCVYCCKCKKFFALLPFVTHSHGDGNKRGIDDPKLFMFVRDPVTDRFDLWHNLCRKAEHYRSVPRRYLDYNIPDSLADYHQQLSYSSNQDFE